jgi:hypothetical protein
VPTRPTPGLSLEFTVFPVFPQQLVLNLVPLLKSHRNHELSAAG